MADVSLHFFFRRLLADQMRATSCGPAVAQLLLASKKAGAAYAEEHQNQEFPRHRKP
jgi:hypothetical protein